MEGSVGPMPPGNTNPERITNGITHGSFETIFTIKQLASRRRDHKTKITKLHRKVNTC
ncbi:MAG: hypothetical protein RBS37_11385 [Bacteroidales bacterium]|nr:hypothetical protein [Bacteroidales bacterium]